VNKDREEKIEAWCEHSSSNMTPLDKLLDYFDNNNESAVADAIRYGLDEVTTDDDFQHGGTLRINYPEEVKE